MNITGWLMVEIKPSDLNSIETLVDSDYQSFIDVIKVNGINYSSYSTSPEVQGGSHPLGLLHDALIISGFKEEISLEIDGVKRFLYYVDSEYTPRFEVKNVYSIIDGVAKLPLSINAMGIYYTSQMSPDYLLYATLKNNNHSSNFMHIGDRAVPQMTLKALKNINSKIHTKEKAMLLFGNRNAGRLFNDIDNVIEGFSSDKE